METASELSEGGYELLRAAVNAARTKQIRSVKALTSRLEVDWPGREADIAEALQFWSANIRQRHPGGVPRD